MGYEMRVAIGQRIVPFQGIDTYVQNLINGISHNQTDVDIFTYKDLKYNGVSFEKSICAKIKKGILKLYRDQMNLPLYLKKYNIDLFHCTENYGIPIVLPCKSIVTIHDIIPLVCNTMNKFQRYRFTKQVRYAIQHSEKVITVSESSKKDIIDYFNISPDKIVITYLGCDKKFKRCNEQGKLKDVKRKFGINKPFILIIGGSNPRKNVNRMINVFENKFRVKYQLVIVGEEWEGKNFKYRGSREEIIFTNFITQDDLIFLYNAAKLFVYPSIYEGFGLPILESMACGTPVIASNTSSMPEVIGEAGLLVDPYDNVDIAFKMNQILSDCKLENELICKGLERIKLFDIENTVKQTVEIYKSV